MEASGRPGLGRLSFLLTCVIRQSRRAGQTKKDRVTGAPSRALVDDDGDFSTWGVHSDHRFFFHASPSVAVSHPVESFDSLPCSETCHRDERVPTCCEKAPRRRFGFLPRRASLRCASQDAKISLSEECPSY